MCHERPSHAVVARCVLRLLPYAGFPQGPRMQQRLVDLLYQGLETELGGVEIYTTAIACAVNKDLKKEWKEYLGQTKNHVRIMRDAMKTIGLDPEKVTPGRKVVHHIGGALVKAMKMAKATGDAEGAELVAAECVVLAETKDHQDWDLIRKCAEHLPGKATEALKSAYDAIEYQEEEHLYHTKGWCRELWVRSLGMDALLPASDERQHVKAAVGAPRAEQVAEPRQN